MNMQYSIIGSGPVGRTLAGLFARADIDVQIANSRGPESLATIAKELGRRVVPVTLERALDADVIFLAVGFMQVQSVAAKLPDWAGKIVVDVTTPCSRPGYGKRNCVASCLPRSMRISCREQSWSRPSITCLCSSLERPTRQADSDRWSSYPAMTRMPAQRLQRLPRGSASLPLNSEGSIRAAQPCMFRTASRAGFCFRTW